MASNNIELITGKPAPEGLNEGTEYLWLAVPHRLRDGLQRYLEDGIVPGSFLFSVLCNDLYAAARHADPEMQYALAQVAHFVYFAMPGSCIGSPKMVMEWSDRGGMRGRG